METLRTSYKLAKENKGAPGVDGVTFEEIESAGVDNFLESIRKDLLSKTYYPLRNRKRAIPKAGGQSRMLSIPTIRDRVVQGAVLLTCFPVQYR
ncbi:hypothetical protein [Candidatus Regiella endosymbiont of Tuberolachnus salignus]|uniref:hypothetical protein n=1 Tax=Candidatus Regiella endosymbiont of Tuberolachnus salignus TaxID=3077956 RepID=UPI0030D23737